MRTLCLGEALVDLVCERHVDGIAAADAFVPRFGGATANVAVAAARDGADVALAGGAGDDEWGRWLRDRLAAEGVALDWFSLVEGCPTPVAFVAVAEGGEPSYRIYGDGIETVLRSVGERALQAVEDCGALFLATNTLVGEGERELTMAARERALELGRPVVFDPNVRVHRWPTAAAAAAAARACVPGAFLVRCNREEAELLTGEVDPERAAASLVKAGARMVVVTLGADGAILRGEFRLDVPGVDADVVSTVGAGDVLTGVLVSRLTLTGYYPAAVPAALPEAVEASARATERWSALD